MSASLPAVFAAVTVVVLVSLFPAPVEAQGNAQEPCPEGGFNPAPVAVTVTTVPIVVTSTTADYFVLYVEHDLDGARVEIPVLVKRGAAGTTTLAENVEALPADHYRVEKYLVTDPADVDGDCIDDLTELSDPVVMNPVNAAPAIAFSDGAVAIPDNETLRALGHNVGDKTYLKFLLVHMYTDTPGVYFLNDSTHPTHQAFMEAAGLELRDVIVGDMAYHPDLVARDGSRGVYSYSLQGGEFTFSFESRAYALLAASLPLLDRNLALYIPGFWRSRYGSELSLIEASRLNPLYDADIVPPSGFLALNPGLGYGRLQVRAPGERPHPRDVAIYEVVPNEMSRVAGIITTVPQTPLSHTNLRAVQDGIPNAFIRDVLDATRVTALLGGYVRYEVTEGRWDLRQATPEEVDLHYESSRPAAVQTPERDLSVAGIKPLGEIGFNDWKAFGVKAANVAVLGTLSFPAGTVPDGFAVPFYFYDEFMKAHGFYDDVTAMLADPDFQTDFDVQDDMLDDLRDAIEDAETPQWIVDDLTTMHATYPEGQSLRYRSSTNNEDLPGFNGAGLYDSKTQNPDETVEDGIDKSLKGVFASLWTFRAFTEREFYRIDHLAAAMGVLVHPNYKDELANGVAVSFDPVYGSDTYYVNTQLGEDLVTNPEAYSVPEEILLRRSGTYTVLATSNLVEHGQLLMRDEQLRQLREHLEVIHDRFAQLYDPGPGEPFAMEIEFKITSDNILAIKQARPWVFSGGGGSGGGGGGGARQTVSDAPTDLLAEATDAAVTLTWEAPEDDGGAAITDYQYRIDQEGEWISIGSTLTTHTVTGLVNGTAYVFQVRAVTAAGSSAPSNRVEATPRAAVTLLVTNFMNGNNGAFNSRVYLWNPSTSAGQVTVRVFTLPLTFGIARELTGPPLDLGTLEARSALNLKLVEDILIPLGIALPYTTDGGNLTLEFTIQAVDVRGAAQVFSSDFAFGTYPMQEIPSASSGSPTVLVANFTNGNNGALHSRVYLWNPSATAGEVTVRVFTLPLTGDSSLLGTLDLESLQAESARNLKLAEDILDPLGIALPYVTDGGNLTLEFTIQAADVRGAAQVFSSSFAFGTVPLQVIQ